MPGLTRDGVRSYIRSSLGRGIVRVELTDENIDAGLQDAVDLINQYMPLHGMRMLGSNQGGRYVISDEVPNIQEVIDVRGTRDRVGTATGANEKQRVTKTKDATGAFVLSYNGQDSAAITVGASALAVQNALENIPALLRNVTVGGPIGGPWIVEFTNLLGSRDVPALVVASQPTTGTISVAVLNNGSGPSATAGNSNDRIDLFDPLVHLSGAAPTVAGVSSYWQALESLEMARRVFGAEVEWVGGWEYDGNRDEQVYALYVQIGANTRLKYGYEYLVCFSADDNKQTGLGLVPQGLHRWLKEYTLCRSRLILGRALRKFQGMPSPEGGDLQMDGIELTTEAESKQEVLEEQIRNWRTSFTPIVS